VIIETHTSPDGVLTLIIDQLDDGDIAVGFTQSQWHTHANLLVGDHGATEEAALRTFVQAILSDRSVIAIRRQGETILRAEVTDDPEWDRQNISKGQTLELRYWSGRLNSRPRLSNAPLSKPPDFRMFSRIAKTFISGRSVGRTIYVEP
jgi:hypothetical protein